MTPPTREEVIHAARFHAGFTLYSEAAQMMPASMSHQKGSAAAPLLLDSLRSVLAAYDAIVAERDATASTLADCERKLDAAVRKVDATNRLADREVVHELMTLRARLAACEKIVEVAEAFVYDVDRRLKLPISKRLGSEPHDIAVAYWNSDIHKTVTAYRAAVAAETHPTTEDTDR